MTPAVGAVLVNFNAGPELGRALRSIAADAGASWEAVVVDNASTDGSAEQVLAFGPPIRLVRNPDNRGFGRAVNQGVAATTAPFVLVMNPDAWLHPGTVAALVAELERHPDCAIAGPRILDPDGSLQGSARGDPDMLTGVFGRTGRIRRWLPGVAVAQRNVVDLQTGDGMSRTVDWLSGACVLIRRAAFERVGGFDEGYFLYWEDADLCRRLRAAGFTSRYVPGATAVHQVGHSSRTANALAIRAFHASAYRYYATHVAPGALNPKRVVARVLLSMRCWWRLRGAAS